MDKNGLFSRKISEYISEDNVIRITAKTKVDGRTIMIVLSEEGGTSPKFIQDYISILMSDITLSRSTIDSRSNTTTKESDDPPKTIQNGWSSFRKYQYQAFKEQCAIYDRDADYQEFLPLCSEYWKNLSKSEKLEIDAERRIDWLGGTSKSKNKLAKKKKTRRKANSSSSE